jgi:predicted RNA-binding Zn-ribbon protein involved in translation (DUF1610 family)
MKFLRSWLGDKGNYYKAAHDCGFRLAHPRTDTVFECPNCSALVKDWQKHKTVCSREAAA